jgi:hypothetical protein
MQNDYVKAALVVVWILAVCALGYVSGITSFAGWTGVVVMSMLPPALMVRFWSKPDPSMSESIRDVLR